MKSKLAVAGSLGIGILLGLLCFIPFKDKPLEEPASPSQEKKPPISTPALSFLKRGASLYYYDPRTSADFTNFGDILSVKIVERMVGHQVSTTFSRHFKENHGRNKLLAVGSILHMAEEGDYIWGSGVNGKHPNRTDQEFYRFSHLDIRAVRGPLTKQFLANMGIDAPEVYGDPALLLPRLFPEFKKSKKPSREYIIIPHIDDEHLFTQDPHMMSCKEDWKEIILAILDSKFVISSSLHGIVVAEAFGIPARYLKVSDGEPLFKYMDYYYGTGRENFQYATTVKEALKMKGEPPVQFDEKALLDAFPYDQFPNSIKPTDPI